ncbi:MAG: hypothetical protein HY662_02080 [Chloroflexi bacterium]|nr:hypothetical protein [Chloroflexota bacterium]
MMWGIMRKLAGADYILVPILALAFYIAFIPHLGYPYAVHIDEWEQIAYSEAVLRAGDIHWTNPFLGHVERGPVALLEVGYRILIGVFHKLSGISWMNIARYFPSALFVVTVSSVYIFTRRMGFGWEAAFFTALIPTTVGILGPAFLVPVALGLTFIPLCLFVAFNYKSVRSYVVLGLLMSFLVIMHAPSAVLLTLILFPFILFGLRSDFKHSLGVMLAIALPLIVSLPWTSGMVLSEVKSLAVAKEPLLHHDLLSLRSDYGLWPIVLSLYGTFILAIKSSRINYSLVASLLFLLATLAIFYSLHYGTDKLYLRGLLYTMLLMGTVAGAGLLALRKLELPGMAAIKAKSPVLMRTIGILLCLVVVGGTLVTVVPARQAILYYHMIDKDDYEAFVWIRDNVNASYQTAIVDPWKATAFTAVTGKQVYTRIVLSPEPSDERALDFIRTGSKDTGFLVENRITIVYTRTFDGQANTDFGSQNPNLLEVRRNIYLLKPASAQ